MTHDSEEFTLLNLEVYIFESLDFFVFYDRTEGLAEAETTDAIYVNRFVLGFKLDDVLLFIVEPSDSFDLIKGSSLL